MTERGQLLLPHREDRVSVTHGLGEGLVVKDQGPKLYEDIWSA